MSQHARFRHPAWLMGSAALAAALVAGLRCSPPRNSAELGWRTANGSARCKKKSTPAAQHN